MFSYNDSDSDSIGLSMRRMLVHIAGHGYSVQDRYDRHALDIAYLRTGVVSVDNYCGYRAS